MTYEEQMKYQCIGEVLGKREMLLYLQKACIANNGTLSLQEINKYNEICSVQEMIFETEEHEGEIQRDIRLQSLAIAAQTN